MKTKATLIIASIFGILGAQATPIVYSSSGLTSPASTITFDEHVFAQNITLTNQYQDEGVLFSPNATYDGEGVPAASLFPIEGHHASNFGGNSPFANPLSLFFTTDQTSVAFALAAGIGSTINVSAFLDGVFVESAGNLPTLPALGIYFGFEDSLFDEIQITMVSPDDQFALLDNIQLGTAPPPPNPNPTPDGGTTSLLMGLALLGLFGAKRKLRGKRA